LKLPPEVRRPPLLRSKPGDIRQLATAAATVVPPGQLFRGARPRRSQREFLQQNHPQLPAQIPTAGRPGQLRPGVHDRPAQQAPLQKEQRRPLRVKPQKRPHPAWSIRLSPVRQDRPEQHPKRVPQGLNLIRHLIFGEAHQPAEKQKRPLRLLPGPTPVNHV